MRTWDSVSSTKRLRPVESLVQPARQDKPRNVGSLSFSCYDLAGTIARRRFLGQKYGVPVHSNFLC